MSPLLLLLIPLWNAPPAQQTPIGAEAVIRKLKALPSAGSADNPAASFAVKADSLRSRIGSLAQPQAVESWLALYDDWVKLGLASDRNQDGEKAWMKLMSALPGPANWPALRAKAAQSASRKALVPVFDDLLGQDEKVLAFVQSRQSPTRDSIDAEQFLTLELRVAIRAGKLDLAAEIYKTAASSVFFFDDFRGLVRLLGPDRARPILLAALVRGGLSQYGLDSETWKLAQSLFASAVDKAKSPNYNLVATLDDFPLSQQLVARFGEDTIRQQGGEAAEIYALGLALSGDLDKSVNFFQKLDPVHWGNTLAREDPKEYPAVYDVTSKLIDRIPRIDLFDEFIYTGWYLGRIDQVADRIDKELSKPNLDLSLRQDLLDDKATIDCALGRTDIGIAGYEHNLPTSATSLFQAAQALKDGHALDLVAEAAKTMGTRSHDYDFTGAYEKAGLFAEAQHAALQAVQNVHDVNLEAQGQGKLLNAYPTTGMQLARLYYKKDQPGQILALFHEFPKWGAADLSSLIGYTDRWADPTPLGFYAAWALSKTGDKETAVRVLRATLVQGVGDDACYELLNDLDGGNALPSYDQRLKRTPMSRGPHVGRGDLLRRMGKLAEAEQDVRTAIALDPTEEGGSRGWRTAEYRVLGQILKAEGKESEAAACDRIVKSVAQFNQALEYRNGGFAAMATAGFRKAIELCPTDGLAHLELARVLMWHGNPDEGLAEFGKAAELTATSEGPVGGNLPTRFCENFSPRAPALAESILTKLDREHPGNPGVLYSLGEAEKSLGNEPAALSKYVECVKAAPNFVMAWREIRELSKDGIATKGQAREAVLAVMRLDPISYDATSWDSISAAGDYPACWAASLEAAKSLPPAPNESFVPLEASKRAMAAGLRPAQESQSLALLDGPGAVIGQVAELRSLFDLSK